MAQPAAQQQLWEEVVVDFGHELITAVHTPMQWSDKRPTDLEFRQAFAATRLSAARIIDYIEGRQQYLKRLVFRNSEGYFSGSCLVQQGHADVWGRHQHGHLVHQAGLDSCRQPHPCMRSCHVCSTTVQASDKSSHSIAC